MSSLSHCRDSGASGYGGAMGGSRRGTNNHAICPTCGKRVRITKDGRLWSHGTRRKS